MVDNTIVKDRMLWMDNLKLLAIYLVVLGHVVLFCGKNYGGGSNFLYSHIYSFHMPLFMTISGFFSFNILEGKGSVINKFRQLLVPCILLYAFFGFINEKNQNMWYLVSLFVCYTTSFIYVYIVNLKKDSSLLKSRWFHILIIPLLCFICFPIFIKTPYFHSYKVDFMLPFFVFGMFLRKYGWYTKKVLLWSSAILFIVLFVAWENKFLYYNSEPAWFVKDCNSWWGGQIDNTNLLCCMYRYLTGLSGSCFFVSLFYHLDNRFPQMFKNAISKYGKYTLHIYILQTFIVEMLFRRYLIFPPGNSFLFIYVVSPLLSILVLIVCILIASALERNPWIDVLLFGNYKRPLLRSKT